MPCIIWGRKERCIMAKLYIKYLKFCKKHKLKAFIPSKYAFLHSYFNLENMELTNDSFTFKEIIKRVKDNGGYCPCAIKKIEATKCACFACRNAGVCQCGLYEKKEVK
jgi:hypothetical protein